MTPLQRQVLQQLNIPVWIKRTRLTRQLEEGDTVLDASAVDMKADATPQPVEGEVADNKEVSVSQVTEAQGDSNKKMGNHATYATQANQVLEPGNTNAASITAANALKKIKAVLSQPTGSLPKDMEQPLPVARKNTTDKEDPIAFAANLSERSIDDTAAHTNRVDQAVQVEAVDTQSHQTKAQMPALEVTTNIPSVELSISEFSVQAARYQQWVFLYFDLNQYFKPDDTKSILATEVQFDKDMATKTHKLWQNMCDALSITVYQLDFPICQNMDSQQLAQAAITGWLYSLDPRQEYRLTSLTPFPASIDIDLLTLWQNKLERTPNLLEMCADPKQKKQFWQLIRY